MATVDMVPTVISCGEFSHAPNHNHLREFRLRIKKKDLRELLSAVKGSDFAKAYREYRILLDYLAASTPSASALPTREELEAQWGKNRCEDLEIRIQGLERHISQMATLFRAESTMVLAASLKIYYKSYAPGHNKKRENAEFTTSTGKLGPEAARPFPRYRQSDESDCSSQAHRSQPSSSYHSVLRRRGYDEKAWSSG